MNVETLIAELRKLSPDLPVCFYSEEADEHFEVERVDFRHKSIIDPRYPKSARNVGAVVLL